jgi:hypothetical protein
MSSNQTEQQRLTETAEQNTNQSQVWEVSKTTCAKIVNQLRQGRTTLRITRVGEGKLTDYKVEQVLQ